MPIGMHLPKGQTGVETLMAVILITGLLLVASVISLQQNLEAKAAQDQKENAAICSHLTTLIDSVGRFSGQTEVLIVLPKPVWVQQTTGGDFISFQSDLSGFFCRLTEHVTIEPPLPQEIQAGVAYIYKNDNGEIRIQNDAPEGSSLSDSPGNPLCNPKTCATAAPGDSTAECGTPSNGCGNLISCGSCDGGETCGANFQCETGCSPKTCEELNAQCGTPDDGCGTPLECDNCTTYNELTFEPDTCNDAYQCECEPLTQDYWVDNWDSNCGTPPTGCNDDTLPSLGDCSEYGPDYSCNPDYFVCETCYDECTPGQPGQFRCNGDNVQVCGNYDSDNCMEWGGDVQCEFGCNFGYCQAG